MKSFFSCIVYPESNEKHYCGSHHPEELNYNIGIFGDFVGTLNKNNSSMAGILMYSFAGHAKIRAQYEYNIEIKDHAGFLQIAFDFGEHED